MSDQVLREFRYRLNPVPTALVLLLACGGFGLFVYFAMYPPMKPVRVKGINLTPNQVRVIMGVLATLAPIGLVGLARGLVSALVHHRRIALTAEAIIVPKPDWWGVAAGKDEMELRFDDIISAEVLPFVGKALQLRFTHLGGKVSIPSNMLPSRRDFDLLSQLLSRVVG